MNWKIRILTGAGTRPAANKTAPAIVALDVSNVFNNATCLTGQHTHRAREDLSLFDLNAERRLPAIQRTRFQRGELSNG